MFLVEGSCLFGVGFLKVAVLVFQKMCEVLGANILGF